MSSYPRLFSLIVLLVSGSRIGESFPDGAPTETCTKHKPNHGATAQPIRTLPFLVQASTNEYEPGDRISVRILGKRGVYFKGFFVQAHDEEGQWIGTFDPTSFSVSHPECAATTHSENLDKEEVTVVWVPPKKPINGTVHFLASILKNFKEYWVDVPATVRNT